MERLSYRGDLMIRTRVARAVEELGDVRLAGVLMRLLTWYHNRQSRMLWPLCLRLPAAMRPNRRTAQQFVADQIARWKKWFAERQERNGS